MSLNKKTLLVNALFLAVSSGILAFLLAAPPESTKKLPRDANHEPFRTMGKKEAERHCESCHAPGKERPLPEQHPPKYRCLFCHKQK